ncbi:hypothetical protein [Prochlorococcus marinus]|uniref:ABC transporter substrate-binding protein n=1 Tax=Prochlorococcus marinus XMU1408 TaxID=2213228 RepID=A0A318RFA3_PROMR|nr:hypothetical protein [Prochlorococcus marinus]MBW3041465.1 hypothetical protein [Prochlorococcus marinus str. XMU1408]PYE02623.1 hypothetical protein DNJ73_02410 [Prochlorococcus marinus XMU1408]
MITSKWGRREFIKYGLISSLFVLSGCSTSRKKLALRGISKSFPSEFINSLSTDWEFLPIQQIEQKRISYTFSLQEKTDLLVLNDGWVSDLPYDSLQEIKASNIRDALSKKATSFLDGLGEEYKNRIFPLAVSPWVILLRNEDSLALKNKNSWEVLFSSALTNQIVFPNSPYLLISIAQKLGFVDDFSIIKRQAKTFDDQNALNWVVAGKANAAVLPLSSCVDSLIKDPRLSILLPQEGSPLNWTVLASPSFSSEPFPTDWFHLLWGPTYLRRLIRKGFLPPTSFSDLRRKNINISQRYQSVFIPEESVWNKCWSLPLLSFEDKKDLALNWNNS